jgi:hypothetical protein
MSARRLSPEHSNIKAAMKPYSTLQKIEMAFNAGRINATRREILKAVLTTAQIESQIIRIMEDAQWRPDHVAVEIWRYTDRQWESLPYSHWPQIVREWVEDEMETGAYGVAVRDQVYRIRWNDSES